MKTARRLANLGTKTVFRVAQPAHDGEGKGKRIFPFHLPRRSRSSYGALRRRGDGQGDQRGWDRMLLRSGNSRAARGSGR